MNKRKIGSLVVSSIGYGCMGLSQGFGDAMEYEQAVRTIREAFECGCTFFDTAEAYGTGMNERLVHDALAPIREQVVIATKLNLTSDSQPHLIQDVNAHVDASLRRLNMDVIDLYYLHFIQPGVVVEDVADCMGRLIQNGKIRGWGLCQCSVEQLRHAHAVTPLTAVQSEYSIMARQFEDNVIPACEELGIGFVAFSPLAKGFLSGSTKADAQYTGMDFRRTLTRFRSDNVQANQPLVDLLRRWGKEKNATPAQISLAWLLHKKDFIVPIPGARSVKRIQENLQATQIEFSPKEFEQLETELSKITIHGDRSEADLAKFFDLLRQEQKS